ncbi:uncharacterized protein TRUGW13939_00653 [Talaromyces rugulosus]|uniref:Calcineurin-like phosphoesterase domain-containing protein n=1 Tax=Talaromyces rugulosus TaxID=121627 RepID=A0A7H8QHX1_TALRU|nr:uncharacterized protein TRUGW13939_00653 [Talaromyces rugulosus]QKX53574.1 hypothetical protein TRUGW13939_00653 [Talaromyces rugulosus]
MSLRGVLQRILAILLPLSVASTLYLYLYPIVQQCAFPIPSTKNNARESSSTFAANGVINTLFQHVGAADSQNNNNNNIRPEPAIFRLLVLADPQIEGDSSLPHPDDEFGSRLRRHWAKIQSVLFDTTGRSESDSESEIPPSVISVLADVVHTTIYEDIPSAIRATLKRVDLFGNDYYLAHIYRTLSWWTRPTHVTVLGDLIGSQWVTDEEFEKRAGRYWQRLFRGGERVNDDLTITGKKRSSEDGDVPPEAGLEPLSRFNSSWSRRIINVAGNHDIGYAGDVSRHRLDRFERVFGRANWDIRFRHPPLEEEETQQEEKNITDENAENSHIQPTLHVINLNDLTLDGPAFENEIQTDSYGYINDLITHRSYPVEDETSFTLLLTHVPLHKREGICVDGPHFSYFDNEDDNSDGNPRFKQGGLREQNHLSDHASGPGILQGIFGMSGDAHTSAAGGRGRRGLILTGHDHEGCDVVHFVNRTFTDSSDNNENENEHEPDNSQPWHWDATRYSPSALTSNSDNGSSPAIREVTLRSMMGMYGGHAALLSLWFDADPDVNHWQYELQTCAIGGQQIWWAIHGLALACVGGVLLVLLLWGVETVCSAKTEKKTVHFVSKEVAKSSDRKVERD